jgi:hypothetical protein
MRRDVLFVVVLIGAQIGCAHGNRSSGASTPSEKSSFNTVTTVDNGSKTLIWAARG